MKNLFWALFVFSTLAHAKETVTDIDNNTCSEVSINASATEVCAGESVNLSVDGLNSSTGVNTQSHSFTSGSYTRIPYTAHLYNLPQSTIEFWYYQESSSEEFIVATEYFNTGWGFHVENNGGSPRFLEWRVSNGVANLGRDIPDRYEIPFNQWIHVAGVHDGSTVYLYIDGNLIDSAPYTGQIGDSYEDIVINRHTWASGSSERLNGKIDELRISNIARYTSNFTPPVYEFNNDSNTLALWHFNGNMQDESQYNTQSVTNGTNFSSNVPFGSYNFNSTDLLWSTGDTTANISVTPTETTEYWLDVTTNGVTCREYVSINVTAPAAPAGDAEQTFCDAATVADLTATGDNIQWYDAATGGNLLDSTTALTDGQMVYASQIVNGCESTDRLEVTVSIQDITITASATEVCAGESVNLSVDGLNSSTGVNTQSHSFTSGSYTRIPYTAHLYNLPQSTIEFWYYQESSSEEFIVATEYFNTGWGFHVENNGGSPRFLEWRVSNGVANLGRDIPDRYEIPFNQWIHVAGVHDGSTVYLYIDGNLIDSAPYTGQIGDSYEDIVINRHTWASGSSERLNGKIDELRISNIARYTSNFTPPVYEFNNDSNTLALWHFNGNMQDESQYNTQSVTNGTNFSSNVPFGSYNFNSTDLLWSTGDTTANISVTPTETTEYWLDVTTNGVTCREYVSINVTAPAAPAGDAEQTFCDAATVADLTATGDNIQWYDAATGGNLLDSTTALTDGQMVYASQIVNGCESTDRLEVTVSIQDITITASATEVCAGEEVTLNVNNLITGTAPSCYGSANQIFTDWTELAPNAEYVNIIKHNNIYYLRSNNDVLQSNNINGSWVSMNFQNQIGHQSSPIATLFDFDWADRLHVATLHNSLYAYENGNWINNGLSGYGCSGRALTRLANNRIIVSKWGYLRDLYISDDNGSNWTNVTNVNNDYRDIIVADNGNVFACGGNGTASMTGLIKSTDNGSSFFNVSSELGINYASTLSDDCEGNLYVLADNSIYKSSDEGESWVLFSNTPFNSTVSYSFLLPISSDVLFLFGRNANEIGLYESNNGGATWHELTNPLSDLNTIREIKLVDNVLVILSDEGVFGKTIEISTSTFLWSTGDTSETISVTPTETTEYWVDVTTNGVTCREYVIIDVTAPAAPTGDAEQTFCEACNSC